MIQPSSPIQLGPIIARGLTSEVFAFGADRVVKLFLPWVRREKVEREFAVTKAVHSAGLPVPNVFEMVEAGGRLGIIFERLHGISMLRRTMRTPWKLVGAAMQAAELQFELHSCAAPSELPSQPQQIQEWIAAAKDLSEADRAAAQKSLDNLPGGNAVCHGDFHPENILFTPKGPMIIDWTTGTRGNPIGDVARTASLIRRAEIPADWGLYVRVLIALSRKFLLTFYLRRYFELRPGSSEDLVPWEPIQKAAISAWRARKENHD